MYPPPLPIPVNEADPLGAYQAGRERDADRSATALAQQADGRRPEAEGA